jgi:hypothetical protein
MKIRRRLTGVLGSFLDGFASRYSDYDGYWVFGLVARETDDATFELLPEVGVGASPTVAAASRIARARLVTLLQKAKIPAECVASAKVRMSKLEPAVTGPVNGRLCLGHRFSLTADATSDLGKRYTAEKIVFVAPHDASVEHRSTRREPAAPAI